MKQVTLISLYGNKPENLETRIRECQDFLTKRIGVAFRPYDIRQVHATIIGLERCIGSAMQNLNFWKKKSDISKMDLAGLLNYFREAFAKGIEVQIGGFKNRDYGFISRHSIPYIRSFSIQGDKVVVMGWPVCEAEYPDTLDEIRRVCQDYNVLHSYHDPVKTDRVDRDLYFRIGLVDPEAFSFAVGSKIESELREKLAENTTKITIRSEDLYIAAYTDDTLPLDSSDCWSLANERVTGEFVENLYR